MSHQGISEVTKESNKTSFGRNQAQLRSYNIGNRWILSIYIYILHLYNIYIYIIYVIYIYISHTWDDAWNDAKHPKHASPSWLAVSGLLVIATARSLSQVRWKIDEHSHIYIYIYIHVYIYTYVYIYIYINCQPVLVWVCLNMVYTRI